MKYVLLLLVLTALALTNANINRVYGSPNEDIVDLKDRQDYCVCGDALEHFIISSGPKQSQEQGKFLLAKKMIITPATEVLPEMIRAIRRFE